MTRPSRTLAPLALAALWLSASVVQAQKADVSLSANRTRVAVGEQFLLEARVDIEDGDFERMEVPNLGDFQVLGERESRPYSFSFNFGQGATSRSSVVRSYSLRALAPGSVHLGPVKAVIDGKTFRSDGLTIEVTGSADQAAASSTDDVDPGASADIDPDEVDPRVFLRAVAEPSVARVGEQVTVSFYLYTRHGLRRAPATTQEPATDGFWVHNLLPPSRQLSATLQRVEGRQYRVYLLSRVAAFPLTPGNKRIGPMTVELGGGGSIFDLLTGPRKTLTRSSKPLEVEVKPLPEQVDRGAPWHVGDLTLRWSATPEVVEVGDAVTLRAELEGTGNLRGVQLPDPEVPGFEVLEPTVKDDVTESAGIVGGTRTFEWLALARQPGRHEAPSPSVQRVQPDSGEVTLVKASPLTLEVQGRTTTSQPETSPGEDAQPREQSAVGLDLGTPRTRARLAPPSAPLDARPWYWPSLALLPLLAAGLFGRGLLERARAARLSARADLRLGQAAEHALEEAARASTEPAERLRLVRKAVLLGVERVLGESAEAWTYDQLERRLAGAPGGSEALAKETAGLLREVEAARFMPGGEEAGRDAATRAAPLLDRLRGLAAGRGAS